MNLPLSVILVGALLISLALLLPAPGEQVRQSSTEARTVTGGPDLTIMDASVRAFGEDGAVSWSLRSPRIAYHLDGRLAFTAPNMLMQNDLGANLRASAGLGTLEEAGEQETIILYSQVRAQLEGGEQLSDQVKFNTERLIIRDQGRQVKAPGSVHIRSHAIDTRAAELDLNLQKQILLLASSSEEHVTTRIEPMVIFE
ncbi:MAG: LPS export ABC transporter periplasmic protein LptC [Gammaproteobacteria bacterium]|nr:LPS export ABC transporter periplasmic protein LptC [Gammaproteobacteria bacterium]MCY4322437.1 LPS export ABC transporter periplasmic protein LptC [Gammaproteobacteria bacterium]